MTYFILEHSKQPDDFLCLLKEHFSVYMKNGLGRGWLHWGERRVTVAAGDDSRMPGEKFRGLDQYAEWAEDRSPRIWCTDEGKSDTIYWLIGCGTGRKERYWVSLWGYWLETWWCHLKEKSRVERAGEGGEKQERRFEQEQLLRAKARDGEHGGLTASPDSCRFWF